MEEPSQCPEPKEFPNGHCDPLIMGGSGNSLDSYPVGTTADCYCFIGYNMNGSDSIVCQNNGSWSNVPECEEFTRTTSQPRIICGLNDLEILIPRIECESWAGDGATRFEVGGKAICSCQHGSQMNPPVGEVVPICSYSGHWVVPGIEVTCNN